MKRIRVSLAMFLLFASGASASADTIRLRTGETKEGRFLAEDDQQFLFHSFTDDAVIEIARSDISIRDRSLDPA